MARTTFIPRTPVAKEIYGNDVTTGRILCGKLLVTEASPSSDSECLIVVMDNTTHRFGLCNLETGTFFIPEAGWGPYFLVNNHQVTLEN